MTSPGIEPAGSAADATGGLDGVPGPGAAATIRLRLTVAYDGTDFCGWARQPDLRSVQGELEHALRIALRIGAETAVRVAVAGRTDAGVHATGQVCHCDVPAALWSTAGPSDTDVTDIRRRCNGLLAHDVRVTQVSVAPPDFHARWSALWRRYTYAVADSPAAQDPRTRRQVLWSPRPLDVSAMHDAAQLLLGEHDFRAYCRARPGASSVRTVQELRWRREPTGPGSPRLGVAHMTIVADAFCHTMVRSLVGAFLAVGDGRWPVTRPADLLRAGVRTPAITSAPARGLTLTEVSYPDEAVLGDQARRSRRWRGA